MCTVKFILVKFIRLELYLLSVRQLFRLERRDLHAVDHPLAAGRVGPVLLVAALASSMTLLPGAGAWREERLVADLVFLFVCLASDKCTL